MKNDKYEYEYHDMIEQSDYIEEESVNIVDGLLDESPEMTEAYYNDGSDEPWMDMEENETGWENYYHNLTEEIDD